MDINTVHIDAILSQIALEFSQLGFVGDKFLPHVTVKHESDKFFRFLKREELSAESEKSLRGVGADAHEIRWDGDTDFYSCEEYAFKNLVADRIRDNSDTPVRPRARATRKITGKLWLGHELRCQAILAGATKSTSPTIKWDAVDADIEADLDAAKEAFKKNCGDFPNKILVNGPVSRAIRRWLKHSASHLTLQDELNFYDLPKDLWGTEPIIAQAVKNTAALGASLAIADVWDDTVGLMKVDGDPGLDSFTFGCTFVKQDFLMKSRRDEDRNGEWLYGSWILQEKKMVDEAAYLLTDVLASS